MEIGDPVVCSEPFSGFARFSEAGQEHGIQFEQNEAGHIGGGGSGVYVSDLDGDGDLDLLYGANDRTPTVFLNDGTGFFVEVPEAVPVSREKGGGGGPAMTLGDVDGDGLPELFAAANGVLWVYHNEGDGHFSAEAPAWTSEKPYMIPGTLSLGDPDGDGDLDLLMAGLEWIEEDCQADHSCPGDPPNPGSPQLLFQKDGDQWAPVQELLPYGTTAYSVAATFTDRDMDGDADLLLLQDQGANGKLESPPAAFFRNDGLTLEGLPFWENDAEARGADVLASGMGIATQDINQDGWFDYCFSDTGPIHCLISDGTGGWFDAGIAMGLAPESVGDVQNWSAWSVEWEDLDNDGFPDFAATGGRPTGDPSPDHPYADALFSGNPDGTFLDQSLSTGFDSTDDHFGLAAADLDGDGSLELVIGVADGIPPVWWNRCGPGHWLEVDLWGLPENRQAFGAIVQLQAGTLAYTKEIQSTRAQGQSPSRLHFGLGDQTEASLHITWPDGTLQEIPGVPVDRRVRVLHP